MGTDDDALTSDGLRDASRPPGANGRGGSWATVTQCPDCGRSLFTTVEDLTASQLLARHQWEGRCAELQAAEDAATDEHPAG